MTRKPEHLKDPSLPSPPFRSYQLFTAITTDSPCTSHQSLTWPDLSLPSPYATIPESNPSQGRRDQSMADGGKTAPSNGGEFLLQLLRRPPQTKPSPAPAAAASSVASPLPINAPGAERRTHPRQQQYEDPAVAAVGPSHSFSPPGFGGALPAQIPPWLLPPVLPQPSPPRMSPPQIGISLPGSSAPPGFSPPGSEYHKARPFTGASRPPFLQGEGQKLGFMPPNLDSVDHRRSNEQNRSFDNGGLHRVQQQQFRHQRQQRPQFHRDGAPAASERNNNIPEGGHSQSRRDHSGWSQPDNQRSLRASEQGTRWANGQHPEARSFFDSRRKAQSAGSSGPYDQDYTRINAIKGAPATPGNELGHDLPNQRSAKSRAPGPSHKPGGSGHPNTMNGGRQDEIHGIERRQDAQKKDSSRSASHFVKREAFERESQIGAQFEYSDTSLALNEESSAIQTVEELYVDARFEFSDTSLTPNEKSRAIRIVEESRCKNEDGDNEIFGEEDVDNATHLGVESFSYKKTLPDPDILVEQTNETLILKEEPDEKSETKNSSQSRKKDFRTDFSRGHNVSSQRVRIQRRSMRCRYDIQRLTPFFLSLYTSLVPAEEEKSKQKQLLLLLEKLVNKEWPDAQLHLYGSCANSFGVSNSDIDLCLAIDATGISKTDILLKLADILQSDNLQNVQALTHARVPIVKLMDPASGISCDICINNLLAVVNTKLLRDYAQIDERLRQLAFIVKHWAKSRSVNETYKGTLSSYAYVLMCIHFLQMRRPAILPCLQEMKATYAVIVGGIGCSFFDQVEKLRGFGNQNKETIAELVWAFFNYWAYVHDYANGVISVRTARILSKQEKDWTRRIGNDRHLICIEDPFETSHDLGRVVDKFTIKILREEFERAADILQFDPNPGVTLFEPYTRESSQD